MAVINWFEIGILIGIFLLLIIFTLVIIYLIIKIQRLNLENKRYQAQIRKLSKKVKTSSTSLVKSRHTPDTNGQPIGQRDIVNQRVNVEEIELNDNFRCALSMIEDGSSIFITGKAGTGKSTLLRYFIDNTKKNVAVLAPTGIAALNVGGQTIHSFFKFPPKAITVDDIKKLPDSELYKRIDAIVIDEISMVRADLLDGIDLFLRTNGKKSSEPFGGTQMIFFGDLFQLPPVVIEKEEHLFFADQYESPFFFSAHVYDSFEIPVIELGKVYRQSDQYFIEILDSIRHDQLDEQKLSILNMRVDPTFQPGDSCITLTPTNRLADQINLTRLSQIPHPEFTYSGVIEGNFPEKRLPTLMTLSLKEEAQVMFVKNDINRRWVNGTIGKIAGLGTNWINVAVIEDGHKYIHSVQQEHWEILKYKYDPVQGKLITDVTGSFKQYPLKLAWAITIHKSQGLTFDRVFINFYGGTFAHGQAYVALSRCRTLEGIRLKQRFCPSNIQLDNRVQKFFETREYDRSPI